MVIKNKKCPPFFHWETSYKNYKMMPIKESLYGVMMFCWNGVMETNDKKRG